MRSQIKRSPIRLPVNSSGIQAYLDHTEDFQVLLLYRAKLAAFEEGASEVSDVHVHSALDSINRRKRSTWTHDLKTGIGGALLGAGVPGFITEVGTQGADHPLNIGLLIAWTLAGVAGIVILAFGIRD